MSRRKKTWHETMEEISAQAPGPDTEFVIHLPTEMGRLRGTSITVYPDAIETVAQRNKALEDFSTPQMNWELVWAALDEYGNPVTNAAELDWLLKTQNFLTLVQPFPQSGSDELFTSKENINLRTINGYSWRKSG